MTDLIMETEDDHIEDLLLKGSPLSQYLRDIGRDDFCSYPSTCEAQLVSTSLQQEAEPSDVAKAFLTRIGLEVPFRRIVTIIDHAKPLTSFMEMKSFLDDSLLSKASHEAKLRATAKKVNAKFSILENLISGDDKNQSSSHDEKIHSAPLVDEKIELSSIYFKFIPIILFQIGFGLVSVLGIQELSLKTWLLSVINWMLLIPMLFFLGYRCYTLQTVKNTCNNIAKEAERFINNGELACKLLDKSFLLIRECEVISMGWTFYHPSAPSLKDLSRKRGCCTSLRRCLAKSSLEWFEIVKSVSWQMIDNLPRDLKIIYVEDGIFNITVEDIQSTFGQGSFSHDGALTSDVLRSLICLTKSQFLEALQISQLALRKSVDASPKDSTLSLLTSLAKAFQTDAGKFEGVLRDIETKYNFTKENEFKEESLGKEPKLVPQNSLLGMKIDSTYLHLKSALGKLQNLENFLHESYASNVGFDPSVIEKADTILCEEIHELINIFKLDLDGARDCADQIQGVFNVKKYDNSDSQGKIQMQEKTGAKDWQTVKAVPDKCVTEPEGDRLIEGMSEPAMEQESCESNSHFMPEQLKLKQQIKESKRLVNELKGIFSLKQGPIGLVPFDLVKKNMNLQTDNAIEEDQDKDFSLRYETHETHESCKPETDEFEKLELKDEHAKPTSYSAVGTETEDDISSNISSPLGPPLGILNDLKTALLNRQANNMISELTIEADTFGSEDDGCSNEESE